MQQRADLALHYLSECYTFRRLQTQLYGVGLISKVKLIPALIARRAIENVRAWRATTTTCWMLTASASLSG